MKSDFVAARELVRGAASRRDFVYIISKGRALMKEGIAHTSVIGLERGNWVSAFNTEWDSTAIAIARSPSAKIVVVGEDGDVAARGGGTDTREEITGAIAIRNARTISGEVYACGMKRQVFRRVSEGGWSDVSAPGVGPTDSAGFEAIDGYSPKEIYAVGWNGEIWQYGGREWIQHGSPTNLIFSCVCCAGDGLVYIAGQRGLMLRGRNFAWELIEFDEEVGVDFWDLCWFQDKLYVATMQALYTLEGNHLAEVDFGDVGALSCYSLSTAENVLWSVGRDDVASFDGTRWRLYE